jgi:uncharacterized YceG family protein
MSPEWPDDPLFDPDDPAAVEREERRREREAKRAQREAKRGKKAAPTPPPPKPAAPPAPPRTPEQEFWDEDPEPAAPVPGQEPAASAADEPAAPDSGTVERGRRRLLGRRRSKDAAPVSPPPPPTPAPPTPLAPSAAPPSSAPTPPAAGALPDAAKSAGAKAPPSQPAIPARESTPPSKPAAAGSAPTSKPPAAEPKTEVQPQAPPAKSVKPAADPDEPQVDPARVSGGTPNEVPVPVPPRDAAASPQGDSLGKAALGGAAGAATVGAAGNAAVAGSGDATSTATPNGPQTGEHQPMSDQPPTGEEPAPTGEHVPGTHEYAPPPAPPEAPTTGEFAPLVRDWDFHDEGDPEMTGAARQGRRRGEDGGKRRGGPAGALLRHPFRILAAVVVILVLLFVNSLFQPLNSGGSGRVEVKIPKGSGVGEVGDLLEKRGVIDGSYLGLVNASTLFQMRVTLDGKRGDLIAGPHAMQKGMSYGDAISALSEEPSAKAKPGIVTVTIPEGYNRKEAAQLVKEDGLTGNYLKATVKSKSFNPSKYGGKGAKTLEGFLFPDTFEMKSHSPVANLVQLQLQDFKRRIKHVNMKYAKSKNLTVFDVLTIASIIEHEAGVAGQRKLVAAVIYNRLHEGMTLGSDATVRFATGNYDQPLTQKQLESESPYNTRVHAGLPPGPIDSPGLAAIDAAAHPSKAGYLFFVTSPDCKKLAFAKTEAEFERDVARYEASNCEE